MNQIWSTYDKDNSGQLDKDEMKLFVADTLGALETEDKFEEEAFEECFLEFDKDGSGFISKGEIMHFIKKMMKDPEN